MPVLSTIKRLSLCAAGLLVAGLGGLSLGNFAQGGAFSFYKERVTPWPSYSMSQPAPQDHSYPVDPGAASPASFAGENPVEALYREDFDPAPETGTSLAAYDADADAAPLYLSETVEAAAAGEPRETMAQIFWTRPRPSRSEAASPPDEAPPAEDARHAEAASAPSDTDRARTAVPKPSEEAIRP